MRHFEQIISMHARLFPILLQVTLGSVNGQMYLKITQKDKFYGVFLSPIKSFESKEGQKMTIKRVFELF